MRVVCDPSVIGAASRSREGASFGLLRHLDAGAFKPARSILQRIYFFWKPFLPDPDDDLVLELAVAAGTQSILSHNYRDVRGWEQFGLVVLNPAAIQATASLRREAAAGRREDFERYMAAVPEVPPADSDCRP